MKNINGSQQLKRGGFWTRINNVLSIAFILMLAGCATVVNKPLSNIPSPNFQAVSEVNRPIRVAIRTSFASGTNTVHLKRANSISEDLATHLNITASDSGLEFFPVKRFDKLSTINYDYLLQASCKQPEHKTRRNKFLLAIGWPATISIIAAPLGIIALSIPGVVKEYTDFEWSISVVPKHYEDSFCLQRKQLSIFKSAVSASGWGTPEKMLEQSYVNTESHLKGAATEFINELNWDLLKKKVVSYARTHPTQREKTELVKHRIKTQLPVLQTTAITSAPIGRRFAVIVGISEYKYASESQCFNNLLYADDDAIAVADMLKQKGWSKNNIRLLVNDEASSRNIGIALESWLTKAGHNDIVLLFWAGHGYPDPEDPEKVYFACYDTDINIPSTGLRMDRVRDFLEERQVRNVIVLADTCHAGKLITRGERGLAVRPYIEKVKKEQNIPKGWVFMVGADTDRKAIEAISWKNGAFTHCLLKALGGAADGYESSGPKDNNITLGELKAYMTSAMPEETLHVLGVAKHPVIVTSTGDPLIWELPLFNKK